MLHSPCPTLLRGKKICMLLKQKDLRQHTSMRCAYLFCAWLADHSPLQWLGCYYANEKEARSHAPVFAPAFGTAVRSMSPVMWSAGRWDCSAQVTAGQVKGFLGSNNCYQEFKTTQWLDLVLQPRRTKTLDISESTAFNTAADLHPDAFYVRKE